MIDNVRGYIDFIYRLSSQNSSKFLDFFSGSEQLLINTRSFKPKFTVLPGDYNAY